jgi:hypothetical protein
MVKGEWMRKVPPNCHATVFRYPFSGVVPPSQPVGLQVVVGPGFEPGKGVSPADLQSAPIGHSGILPPWPHSMRCGTAIKAHRKGGDKRFLTFFPLPLSWSGVPPWPATSRGKPWEQMISPSPCAPLLPWTNPSGPLPWIRRGVRGWFGGIDADCLGFLNWRP